MENLNELKHKTISGLFWKFGERITAQLITFIVSMILARILMPEDYGIIALVTVFITLANVFVTNGLGTALVQKKNADNEDFSTIFLASLILSLGLYIIIFLTAPFVAKIFKNEIITVLLRVMGLRIPIASINSIQHAYVSQKMIYKKFFFATLFGTIVSAVVGIIMAYLGYGVWALVAQYLTNTVIDTIVLFFTIDWRPKLYFSVEKFKNLFSFGWKVMVTSFIGTFFEQLKSFIIGVKYDSASLAYYNRGEQIPNLVTNNVNSSIETVLFSTIAKIQDDKETVKNTVRKIMKLSCYFAFPLLFGLFAISEPLILILLTEKWSFSIPFLRVFCIQSSLSILGTVNLQAIKGIGESKTLLKLEFLKKPIYIAILLIAMFISPMAIAIGNLIYNVIGILINMSANKKHLNYSFIEQFTDALPSFILAVTMAIIVLFIGKLKINLILVLLLQIIFGIAYYIILSILFKLDSFKYIINYIRSRKRQNND